jgi:hypothetical protein
MSAMPRSVGILAIGVIIAVGNHAAAMSTRVADLATLARRADLVVLGEALERESYWQEGRIYNRILLRTDEVWSGTPESATIEVITLGGVVANLAQHVEGAPVFTVGERVVLLLAREQAGRYFPVGLYQGVFRVTASGANTWVRRDSTRALVIGQAATPPMLSLAALRNLVFEAIGARNH